MIKLHNILFMIFNHFFNLYLITYKNRKLICYKTKENIMCFYGHPCLSWDQ